MPEQGEPRNQPKPSDWLIPPEVIGQLEADQVTALSEREWDGVPAPLLLTFGLELADRAVAFGDSERVAGAVSAIEGRIAEEQARYPESSVWDGVRGSVITKLLDAGHGEAAFDFAWTIHNPRVAAVKMVEIDNASRGAFGSRLAERVVLQEDPARRAAMLQALRDLVIETDPLSRSLQTFNRFLEVTGIETDHISGWIDSQRQMHPDWDWEVVANGIGHEPFWVGMPMGMRQNVMWHYCQVYEEIARRQIPPDRQDVWLQSVIPALDVLEDVFPEAPIFGHIRANLSDFLLKDYPGLAVEMASSIRSPDVGASVVMKFVDAGKETEAIEVAMDLRDPKLVVEVLAGLDWQDEEAPLRRLGELISSNRYPKAKRIAVLTALVEWMEVVGETESVVQFQAKLDELRAEMGGEV
jgi:hypothetical protein